MLLRNGEYLRGRTRGKKANPIIIIIIIISFINMIHLIIRLNEIIDEVEEDLLDAGEDVAK